jgi:hypothetical protein
MLHKIPCLHRIVKNAAMRDGHDGSAAHREERCAAHGTTGLHRIVKNAAMRDGHDGSASQREGRCDALGTMLWTALYQRRPGAIV